MAKKINLDLTVPQACAVWHYFNGSTESKKAFDDKYSDFSDRGWRAGKHEHMNWWQDVNHQLVERGIDPELPEFYKPTGSLKAGDYDVTFRSDGDLDIGCQRVSKAQIVAIYKKLQGRD